MAIVTTEGVVLKIHALGDTSRIVTAYTRDFGLRKFVAKGARKLPSRFGLKATRGDQTGTDNRLLDGFVCATDARTGWTGIDTPTPLINSALPTPAATTT